jgi:hypothetical protein
MLFLSPGLLESEERLVVFMGVHEALDRIFLGRKFSQVHRLLDSPHRTLGRRHRALFHDPLSAIAIGYAVGELEGAMSALLHIAVDNLFTELKKQKRSC